MKIWNSLFGKIILTFLISMVPVLELRGAIPIGVAHGLDYRIAIAVSILGNLVPVPFIVLFIRKIFAWLRTKSERLNGFVTRMEQRALKKSDTVRRARFWGLFILWPFRCRAPARGRARSSRPCWRCASRRPSRRLRSASSRPASSSPS